MTTTRIGRCGRSRGSCAPAAASTSRTGGRPAGLLPRAGFRLVRLLDGHANTRAHATGSLPPVLTGAGFTEVTVDRRLATAGGTLELLTAVVPAR